MSRGKSRKVGPSTKVGHHLCIFRRPRTFKFVLLVINTFSEDTFEQYSKATKVVRIESKIKKFLFNTSVKIFTRFVYSKPVSTLRNVIWQWHMKLICIRHAKHKLKLSGAL